MEGQKNTFDAMYRKIETMSNTKIERTSFGTPRHSNENNDTQSVGAINGPPAALQSCYTIGSHLPPCRTAYYILGL